MNVVINSTSEFFTKGGNLFFEKFNDPVKINFFSVSSFSFLDIESFFGSEIVFSINDILIRLSGKSPSIFFSDQSNFEINSKFGKIRNSFFMIHMESDFFSGRFNLELSSIKSSLDFIFF